MRLHVLSDLMTIHPDMMAIVSDKNEQHVSIIPMTALLKVCSNNELLGFLPTDDCMYLKIYLYTKTASALASHMYHEAGKLADEEEHLQKNYCQALI